MTVLSLYVLAVGTWKVAADCGHATTLPLYVQGHSVGDKVTHFLVVGLFAVLLARAIRLCRVAPGRSLVAGMIAAAALSTVEELTNMATPHRTYSPYDLLANWAGVLVFGLSVWTLTSAKLSGRSVWPAFVRPHAYVG